MAWDSGSAGHLARPYCLALVLYHVLASWSIPLLCPTGLPWPQLMLHLRFIPGISSFFLSICANLAFDLDLGQTLSRHWGSNSRISRRCQGVSGGYYNTGKAKLLYSYDSNCSLFKKRPQTVRVLNHDSQPNKSCQIYKEIIDILNHFKKTTGIKTWIAEEKQTEGKCWLLMFFFIKGNISSSSLHYKYGSITMFNHCTLLVDGLGS